MMFWLILSCMSSHFVTQHRIGKRWNICVSEEKREEQKEKRWTSNKSNKFLLQISRRAVLVYFFFFRWWVDNSDLRITEQWFLWFYRRACTFVPSIHFAHLCMPSRINLTLTSSRKKCMWEMWRGNYVKNEKFAYHNISVN